MSGGALARWLPGVGLALYLLGCLALWSGKAWKPEWDGAVYLETAQSLAAGEGYAYRGEPFFLRPPGLPWLLSFVVAPAGFDPARAGAVNGIVMLFAGLAAAAIFAAVRRGHGPWTSSAVAALAASSPLFLQLFGWTLAEYPFAASAFAGIALLEASFGARGRTPRRVWILAAAGGACLAAAILFRTVGVLLLPGVVLVAAWRGRGWGRLAGLLPVAIAGLLVVPWFLHARAAAARAEVPVEQDLLLDYGTAMFHVDPGDPGSPRVDLAGWRGRIAANGSRLAADLTAGTVHLRAGGLAVQIAVLALVLAGLVLAVRRRGPTLLEWLALAYTALLLTYFAYDPRLAMPLAPLVYLYLVTAAGELGAWLARRAGRPILRPAVGAAACAGLLAASGASLAARPGEGTDLGASYRAMADWIRAETPPGARILCNQAPILALLTDRPCYTYRFVRSADILAKYDIDYVLFDASPPPQLEPLVRARRVRHWAIELGAPGRATIVQVKR
ncbi:MAG: hypothetical protein AB1726_01405 [Planctomycetota bacterium]